MAQSILVADDDPQILELVTGILKAEGYDAIAADNGEDALRLAREKKPSLIFLDIKMPKKDGIEVCKELKADDATKYIPIVMLSSTGQLQEIQRAMFHGADSYITKPSDRQRILETVKSALSGPSQNRWLHAKRGQKSET